MLQRYAVLGNPIKHSRSPQIHQLFATQFGHQLQYDAIELPIGRFSESLRDLVEQGLKGANVTVPFKQDALAFADAQTERARLAGAANTLVFEEGRTLADNTDGAGLVSDLQRLYGALSDTHVVLIGAGGAARGVVLPLFNAGVGKITLMNRTLERAYELADMFAEHGDICAISINAVTEKPADIIVNCTSSSLHGELPGVSAELFRGVAFAYDMFYSDDKTTFLLFAEDAQPNIRTADGIGMLVGQAAESYRLWWGVEPDVAKVIESLRP